MLTEPDVESVLHREQELAQGRSMGGRQGSQPLGAETRRQSGKGVEVALSWAMWPLCFCVSTCFWLPSPQPQSSLAHWLIPWMRTPVPAFWQPVDWLLSLWDHLNIGS